MAIRYAVATGNWSNTATWNGGTLPTGADDVYSNTFTVTIDTSPTVLSISNASVASPVVAAGGSFVPTNGIKLKATVSVTGGFANTGAISSSLASPSQATIESPLFKMASSSPSLWAVNHSGTGILNLVGSIKNDLASNSFGLNCVINNGSGTLNVTGDITCDTTGANFYGGGSAVINSSNGTVNISGNALIRAGGQVGASAVINAGSGTVILTGGTITGHTNANSSLAACINGSTGTFNIAGSAIAGTGSPAILNSSTGTINHSGTCTANNGVPAVISSSISASVTLTGPFITSSNGTNPVYSPRWFWVDSNVTPTYYQIRTANLATIRPLYTADSIGGNPVTSNVRLGTVYGPVNELTGTMAVPSPSNVRAGVAVDNTVGTGLISADSLWAHPLSAMTVSGSIGERVKNVLTPPILGEYLAAFGPFNSSILP